MEAKGQTITVYKLSRGPTRATGNILREHDTKNAKNPGNGAGWKGTEDGRGEREDNANGQRTAKGARPAANGGAGTFNEANRRGEKLDSGGASGLAARQAKSPILFEMETGRWRMESFNIASAIQCMGMGEADVFMSAPIHEYRAGTRGRDEVAQCA